MANTPSGTSGASQPETPQKLDWLGGLLSYVLPGLGQIVQGRVAKGVLFLVSLNVLFWYGMWLGEWRNVYLPRTGGITQDLYNRPHFAGQFWIGVSAWPAIIQYATYDPEQSEGSIFGQFQREPQQAVVNELQRAADKSWDLGWVYTVIAGVLNLLVIYDAIAGPAYRPRPEDETEPKPTDESSNTTSPQ